MLARTAWAISLLACTQADRLPPVADDTTPRVDYAGCQRVIAERTCVAAADDVVALWVERSQDATVTLDGNPIQPEERTGAAKYVVQPLSARSIVEVTFPGNSAVAPWRLALVAPDEPGWLLQLEADERQDRAGDAEIATLLERLEELGPRHRGRALAIGGRIARRLGRYDDAAALLTRAIDAHGIDAPSDLVRDTLLLARVLRRRPETWADGAALNHRLFSEPPAGLDGHLESTFDRWIELGIVYSAQGDHGRALRCYREAQNLARRIDVVQTNFSYSAFANEQVAHCLQESGRHCDALAIRAKALPSESGVAAPLKPRGSEACGEAALLGDYTWSLILLQEAGYPAASCADAGLELDDLNPDAWLERGLQLDLACGYASTLRSNLMVNQAFTAFQRGDLGAAERHLGDARRVAGEMLPDHEQWVLDLEGRIALRQGAPQRALKTYRQLEAQAWQTGALGFEWRAKYGQASALRAQGETEAAVELYESGRDLFFQQVALVSFREGRDAFVAQHRRATQDYASLLLQSGRQNEAFSVIRDFGARYLNMLLLDGRSTGADDPSYRDSRHWLELLGASLADCTRELNGASVVDKPKIRSKCTALREQMSEVVDRAAQTTVWNQVDNRRTVDRGELLLTYFELQDGWVGFAARDSGLLVRLVAPPGEAPSSSFLAPFADAIERAETLTILATGELSRVDFHAMPYAGDVLLAHVPVSYALDLVSAAPRAPTSRPSSALVVTRARAAGPVLDHLESEGHEVERALRLRGYDVDRRSAPLADREAVVRGLGTAALFHFADHYLPDDDPWEGGIQLSNKTVLTKFDILGLPHMPDLVVLSACRTAVTSHSSVATLGLAQAFVVGGAEVVIATTRDVDDELAFRFSSALYAPERTGSDPASATAYQRAALAIRDEVPGGDWSSFRRFVP